MCFTSLLCRPWPDLWPFHRLYCKRSGAPNDRMFPNTPEVSQMVFSVLQKPVWLIWSCPKNYLYVRMRQGELCLSRKFQLAFSSHPKVLATLEDIKQPCFHRKLYRGHFVFIPKVLGDLFSNNNCNILILKCENTTSENRI